MSFITNFRNIPLLLITSLAGIIFSSCSINGRIVSTSNSAVLSSNPITISNKAVSEFGIATIPVSLGKTSSQDVSFNYSTQDNSAVAGVDYTSTSGSVTIPAGQTSVAISIPIINNLAVNSNKTFSIQLSNPVGSVLATTSATVEIQDNDSVLLSVVSLAGWYNNYCALFTNGGVKCWGKNTYGQLGNGTNTDSSSPVDVVGLTSGVSKVFVSPSSANSACALTTSGALKCWGRNDQGQLGDGTTTDSNVPVNVSGLGSGVTAATTGGGYACAVVLGGAKCWGDNYSGQVGDGTTTDRLTPVDVSGLTTGVANSISAASAFGRVCAVLTNGDVKCWGHASGGLELGPSGPFSGSTVPVSIGFANAIKVSSQAQYHSCVLLNTGEVRCWGWGTYGQLGDGLASVSANPVTPAGLTSGVSDIIVGENYSCASLASGGMKCWGDNYYGTLGDGSMTEFSAGVNTPATIPNLIEVVTPMTSLGGSICVLMPGNTLKCWGMSIKQGQEIYEASGAVSGFTQVSNGYYHSCAVTSSAGVKCWGQGLRGRLGNGATTYSISPVDVTGLSSVKKIVSNTAGSCALTISGGVKCWGDNQYGQLGDGTTTNRNSPVDVSGLTSGVTDISGSNNHMCALTSMGGMKCWGYNLYGQLGDGTNTNRSAPADVTGLTSGVAAISSGSFNNCAVVTSGQVKCWGNNGNGQLGDGTTTSSYSPVDVTGVATAVRVLVGGGFACALMNDDSLKCWGANTKGELANGSYTNSSIATPVTGFTEKFVSLAVAGSSVCALTTDHAVKCWGANNVGQLMDGTKTNNNTAVNVQGLSSGILQISAYNNTFCALTSSGAVKCWGEDFGHFGSLNRYLPQVMQIPQ